MSVGTNGIVVTASTVTRKGVTVSFRTASTGSYYYSVFVNGKFFAGKSSTFPAATTKMNELFSNMALYAELASAGNVYSVQIGAFDSAGVCRGMSAPFYATFSLSGEGVVTGVDGDIRLSNVVVDAQTGGQVVLWGANGFASDCIFNSRAVGGSADEPKAKNPSGNTNVKKVWVFIDSDSTFKETSTRYRVRTT